MALDSLDAYVDFRWRPNEIVFVVGHGIGGVIVDAYKERFGVVGVVVVWLGTSSRSRRAY